MIDHEIKKNDRFLISSLLLKANLIFEEVPKCIVHCYMTGENPVS